MLRACYGGMHGDIRLLRGFAHTWHSRLFRHPDARPSSSLNSMQLNCSVVFGHAAHSVSLSPQKWRRVLNDAYTSFKGTEVRLYYSTNRNQDEEPVVKEASQMLDMAILHRQDLLKVTPS